MALPTIDECTCPCHDPSGNKVYASHTGECCVGMTLAWGSWGIDDVEEAVSSPVAFSDDQED